MYMYIHVHVHVQCMLTDSMGMLTDLKYVTNSVKVSAQCQVLNSFMINDTEKSVKG